MGLINYLTSIYRRVTQESRRRLQDNTEPIFVRLHELLTESREIAHSGDPDAFEHDMVFTRKYIAEAERFRERLLRKEMYRDAHRIKCKIDKIKEICNEARERYRE